MKIPNGGPAFPSDEIEINEGHWEGRYQIRQQFPGMSLRDYFAAAALTALLTNTISTVSAVAASYRIADTMLAEREKEQL